MKFNINCTETISIYIYKPHKKWIKLKQRSILCQLIIVMFVCSLTSSINSGQVVLGQSHGAKLCLTAKWHGSVAAKNLIILNWHLKSSHSHHLIQENDIYLFI